MKTTRKASKSEEVWLNQEERNKKIGPYCDFLYLYDKRKGVLI